MDIGSIQKRKFLNNINRLLYSNGTKPLEADIRDAFTKYFTRNRPGLPINVDYNKLQVLDITNVDLLNELMVNGLFNLEILYDSIIENNNQLFSVVTALNNKMQGLKVKRQQLEAKVDQILFANSNTDGYFYSIYDTFANLDNIDLGLTTAFVDTFNSNVTLPKITNLVSNSIINNQLYTGNITVKAQMNQEELVSAQVIQNFDALFDGLNDTYWDYEIRSQTLGIASVTLAIPLDASLAISKIDATLLTSAPCGVLVRAIPSSSEREEQVKVRDSTEDYSKFSFAIPADTYSSIIVTLVKTEPDRLESSSGGMYVYHFGIRDLVISSSYYDTKGILVSNPLTVPTVDNGNLSINTVALDVESQTPRGTSIEFYVAPDTPAESLGSFNWVRIEPNKTNDIQNVVSFVSSNVKTKIIDTNQNLGDNFEGNQEPGAAGANLELIPITATSDNQNELNPVLYPFSDKTVYRICKINQDEKLIEPFILGNVNTIKHYGIILPAARSEIEQYKSLDTWKEQLATSQDILIDNLVDQVGTINPGIFSSSIGYLEVKLLAETDNLVTHVVTKSSANFNLGIYLNGSLIGDLPLGTSNKSITWNIVKGVNNIVITYDKNFSGLISFNLMSGRNLTEYGILYQDYLSYVDPIQFRNNRVETAKLFTMDTIFGSYEILSNQSLVNRSILRYYSSTEDLVKAVRYRADLARFDNPLQTPILDSLRIKFKHNDIQLS